jgi:hypothetical protein
MTGERSTSPESRWNIMVWYTDPPQRRYLLDNNGMPIVSKMDLTVSHWGIDAISKVIHFVEVLS